MEARTAIKETEESEAEKKKKMKMGAESSIFSTILADIEQNPTILQERQKLSAEFSIFSPILAVTDKAEDPTIRSTKKTPVDFARTVPETLTRSSLVDVLNQELKILRSEMNKTKGNPNYLRGCDCVKEGKVERRGQVKFLADEVPERISKGDLNSEIPTDAEDSLCKQEDGDILDNFDEMLSTMLGDESEEVNNAEGGGGIDEFIDEMLEKIEKDGSYLDRIKEGCLFGELLENLLRDKLREKAEKEEKEISSWITDGEPQVEIRVAKEEKQDKIDTKKKSPVKVKSERSEQESTVTKRNYYGSIRRLFLIEKLRERDEKVMKRRAKAARFVMEFSFLVSGYMFLIPNELLVSEIGDYWIGLKRFGVDGDDKGTSVIIGKLEEVFQLVSRSKEHYNVNLPESIRFDDYIPLCAYAIQILGKIVWALRCNQCEQYKFSHLDSQFEDFHKVLMKMELKLAEMKQRIYRSVSADYESFSKSERFDRFLRRKLMKRANTNNVFGRLVIKSYLLKTWKSLFKAEALHDVRKKE